MESVDLCCSRGHNTAQITAEAVTWPPLAPKVDGERPAGLAMQAQHCRFLKNEGTVIKVPDSLCHD